MAFQGTDSLLLEDFGQKVDLTRRIREVLVNYPEGTTVLKELIQNADDAGATKVCLCLDRRVHAVDSLLSDKLAEWQGPALLAFNDAEFTEDDFASISRIGGSKKQGQAWKTGRFGVGFNSVYHLTDLPSFVSGKYVVLFDPQGVYLPNISVANPGKRIEYVSSSAISIYKDQFFPYCAFGCDMKEHFHGTLFRFPLRNADQGAISKLSRQAYAEEDISSMFAQLYEEGIFSLLFLKSVLSVEMYVWDAGAPEPQKLYSCCVSSSNDDTIWHRQALMRQSNSVMSANNEMDSFSLDFVSEAVLGTHMEKKTVTFFIVQAMASASSKIGAFAAAAVKEYDIHLLPWASVAACISDGALEDDVLKHGQAFCFLPLPVRTGLAVQVNGYFEVSSNRRSIWYGADMDRGGKLRSDWNRLLLEDVVAPAFTRLLLDLRGLLGPYELYYSLWPQGSFEEPWNLLVDHIYSSIGKIPVLYSDLEGGKWVSPSEAFLHDNEFSKSKELGEALVLLGMPIVHLSNSLFDMLLKYSSSFTQRVVSPVTVRHFLTRCELLLASSRFYKLVLLEYCLQDLIDAEVGQYASGLPLLPLASGDFGLFSEASKGILYFVCSELEYTLLQQIPDRVIDHNIPLDMLSRLTAIAMSSTANIVVFDVQYLLQLLPRFFPAEWRYKECVLWYPETSPNHPSSSWFMLFWQYLRDRCETLSIFCDWPILPTTSGYLYRASRRSKLINAEKLSNTLRELLAKIGCKTLNPSYGVEHHELSQYVCDVNGASLLEAIFDRVSLNEGLLQLFHNNIDVDEKNELRQFVLDPNWYVRDCLTDYHIRNCRRLPIFKVYSGASPQTFTFSDLENPRKYLPPSDVPDYFLGGEFIGSLSDNEEEILRRFYGIEKMGKARFYQLKVLNRIGELQPEFRNKLMISIVQDLPRLCVENISIREALRKLEFVPTFSGVLKCPEVLYDPRNEELFSLLEDSDNFPSGVFQESGVLDMLLGLGLRTSVSPEAVIQSARQVELLMHKDQKKAHLRGKVLLSYLEVNASKWSFHPPSDGQRTMNRLFSQVSTTFKPRNLEFDVEKFWNDLRMICWCPVLVDAPYPALPWPVVSSMVAPPKLVRLNADLWLGSASMRILDGECSSTALSSSLGWSSPPAGSVISAQLLELGKNNELVTDQVLRQELTVAMPRIYSILTSMIGSDEMDIVKAVLEGCRWIWVGDGFATSDEVVLNGPLHLAPYIRVIPVDLAVFRELFLELGIREVLKPTDYANILSRMAEQKADMPLDRQELRAAVLVVQHLAEVRFQDLQVQIYLPDVSSRLFPAANLVYNDAPWLLGSGEDPHNAFFDASTVALNARRTAHKFVHGNISNDVAEKLGVSSLRRILLAESSDSMNLSLSGATEAFGQHEALTTRLKHIVEMYADGPGILFELVQNAEDAGASEVVFLLDKTQYGTSSVLSPEMADWQGPALYCFNSSIFSQQDLYAISRIGQDSKLEKPLAIGRFGLGFNCVYHFTDIPAFVSGENLVMFDPHACNLPGISPSHPGLRIRFAGKRILEQFPDQFTPFLHFGCDLQQSFPGTLFRFPLRTESAASRSQIKKEKYAVEDVLSLFSSFSEVVSEVLLFLRNVKTISLFVKDGVGHEMQLLHRVDRYCINENETNSEPGPLHPMLGFIRGNQQAGIDKDQFLNMLRKTPDNDLPWYCQKIMVMEHKPSSYMSHLWMVSESLGGGRAKKKSLALENRSHNFIPWACVAAHLQSANLVKTEEPSDTTERQCIDYNPGNFRVPLDSVEDRRDLEGRAFCFLPLPITTGLPTHINAYFELSSNRRDIWFGSDMTGGGKTRSDWNIYVLEDVVAPAYGHLLEKLAFELGPCDLFFTLWPTKTGLEPWASLVRKLYISIADLGFRVLYTKAREGQWIPTKQAIFPDFTFPQATELIEALSDAGLPMVIVSKPVVERFMEVCPSLHYLTPQLLRTLLIRRNRGFKNRDAMILTLEYCLSDIEGPGNCDCLHGLPLVPLASGLFMTFNRKSEGERIFVVSGDEYDLLKESIPHLLVDFSVPGVVHRKLHDIAEHGHLNISLLTCHLLEGLFPRFLPADWQHAKQVSWDPGHRGQPSLEWMAKLWNYLKSSCDDLSIFSRWPILPVGKNCLLRLVRNSNVIKDDGWSENMASLLEKMGCFLLRSDVPIDHPQLNDFVQDPTASGILDAILAVAGEPQEIEKLFGIASEGEVHELRSFILQSKWFCGDQMNPRHIETIKHLPMFESYRSRKLVTLVKPTKWLKPEGVHDDLLNEEFIRTESEREMSILRSFLGLREPGRVEFYKDYVLNRMAEFLPQTGALSAILQDVKLLIEEDTSIKDVLSQTAFVLAANGSWKHPSRLYDPRIDGFKEVLHREAFFPSDKFLDAEMLDILVSLGLRRTLGLTGLLDCALSVSMLHDSGDPEAVNYGRRLLAYLNSLGSKLSNCQEGTYGEISSEVFQENGDMVTEGVENVHLPKTYMKNCCNLDHNIFPCLGDTICDKPEEEFWLEMKAIPWCPVYVNPPLQGLPWRLPKYQVACPSIVRPRSQMWMVSSMMHILDGECHSSYLQSKLGWVDSPNINILTTQLSELSQSYGQLKFDSELKAALDSVLQKEIPVLYLKLQEFVGNDDFMVAESALNGISWVWIGDDFISPKALAFDSPVKFHPYLYAVPSELSEFRDLLLALGVRPTFDSIDYFHVLQRLQHAVKGSPLLPEQLSFVHCVLEAVADCYSDKPLSETSNTPLLVPDSSGILMSAMDLVYNDAPWMEKNAFAAKRSVHPSISNDLASRLGIQSLRCLAFVEEEMTKDLPCMDYSRVCELLALYGNNDFLLFDLLELADCCKAKKLHLILDKREHPRQSLLQHNLGEFQGPALLAILEGATLSRDEVSSLQFLPPWRLRGSILNYGLGLLSCYFICDLLSIVSGGCYYMFDPRGLALALPSNPVASAKMFSLTGTDLTERFSDQFNPMLVGQNIPWSSLDTTVIRMPLSLECMKDGLEEGLSRIKLIFDRFLKHSSTTLLFLKSVLQISLSTWEEGNNHPCQDYSIFIDPSSSVMRNPFSDKKWRKFHLSRLFSSSTAAIKMHTIDVNMLHRGTKVVDKWLVVLSLGSGQSRNMALDRHYLAYDLTPVAGVAAHISRNGQPVSAHSSSRILSPLPLSGDLPIPVTAIGCFLVCHNGGRYLFKYQDMVTFTEAQPDAGNQLKEAWNRELMCCVRDSYVEMVLEIQKLRRDPSNSSIESALVHSVSLILEAYKDRIYLFWPRSNQHSSDQHDASNQNLLKMLKADWECIIKQVIRPFYARLVDLPVWQLYSGNLVKAEEGMFLAQPGNGVGDSVPPATVCSFIKEHYPVFSVPWELVTEIQAVGVEVREIRPKMVRDLLRASSSSIVLRSVETYLDVLEYSMSDIQLQESSASSTIDASLKHNTLDSVGGGSIQESSVAASTSNLNMYGPPSLSTHSPAGSGADALEVVTNFGKALFDFGRGVVEDFGIAGVPMLQKSVSGSSSGNADQKFLNIAAELKGLPCPTATRHLARLGISELWIANKEQQKLMLPLAAKFINPKCLGRPILDAIFSNQTIQRLMKLQSFSPYLLASHMKLLFSEHWVNNVMNVDKAPWFSWERATDSSGEGGPSPEWIRLFWKNLNGSSGDFSLFFDWPLIPAFLGRPILCRVREHNMVFMPPVFVGSTTLNVATELSSEDPDVTDSSGFDPVQSYVLAFEVVKSRHPSLLSLLNKCNIPVYDTDFLDCAAPSHCLPMPGQSLGQVIASKFLAAKQAGYFSEPASLSDADRDYLFTLFASDFNTSGDSPYKREELDVLRDLPIYKTVVGSYTRLYGQDQCIISAGSFFQPHDERCLFYTTDSGGNMLFRALDVLELHDQEILVRFALPGFENKSLSEKEDILIYLFVNWKNLQMDPTVVGALKDTKFVRTADELCLELFKPQDLFDPGDSILTSVFSGEKKKFPGERFVSDEWLHILRKTGLLTATEADVIVECAKKVELLGSEYMKSIEDADDFEADFSSQNEIPFEIWSLSGAVLDAIFSNFAVFYSSSFCNALSKISFLPAEKGFPSIDGKKGGKRVLCSYNEAILLKDWPLAWSCAPILSRQNVVPPEYSWGAFSLRSPPVFSTVLKHLQIVGRNCGEDTLAHWPMSPGMMTVEGASCEILKYLDKIWGSLSASDILELRKVAFMPVANGTRLVTANSLFVRLTVNLSPFAFELPTIYLHFVEILKDLGLQEVLSVACAKDLLMNLQKACGYQRLNPNELRAVMEILHFICNGSVQENKSDGSYSDVIVPDDGCRLVLASLCVYIDPYGSRYFRCIDTSRLRFVHPYLSEGICTALGIRKLSEVVVEELDHGQRLQFLDEIDSIPLSMVRQKLSSRSFQLSVWTVLNSINSYIPASGELALEWIESSLKNIAEKLQFVHCLSTRFTLLPTGLDITRVTKQSVLPEWENGSGHRTLYFVDQSKNCIIVAEPPGYISVLDVISIIVSQVLGSATPLPIGPLFSCPEGLEKVVVSTLRLGSERGEIGTKGGSDWVLGKDLIPQDALQVQFHPLRPFYAGEIVAWRTGKNGEKLKYGRVPLDVRPSAGQALYRLKVETVPGIYEPLLSSQVFSFRAISTVSEAFPLTLPEVGDTETSSQIHIPMHEIAGKGKSVLPQLQGAMELQYGRVSPAELVDAVRDMLSAAGIDMDVQKQSLLQTTLTLEERLKESQAALLLEQEKADVAAKEADTAKAAWVCRICLSAEVDVTIVPCGHVLCRRCSSAVSRCPFCRIQASRTMKIFRP